MTIEEIRTNLEGHEWNVQQVEISYHPTCNVPNNLFKVVLLVDGKERLYQTPNICVGFDGPMPHKVADILDFLGVISSREDILTEKKRDSSGLIHLEYCCS